MDLAVVIPVFIAFFGWGTGAFISKLAADRIGSASVFWDLIGYIPAIILYCFAAYDFKSVISLTQTDKPGVFLAILSGTVGSLGAIGFYILMAKSEASVMAPLTALYPALTVILAIIFLHESITLTKITGILFSLVAIYLLSK